jgi:hypothetical protein
MSFFRLAAISMVLLMTSIANADVDLSKIERKLTKEPAYRAKPKYCLLVIGLEAKTRVWLVQDGDTLYVDRDGNGDLTEPGEKVVAEKSEDADDGVYTFNAGDIHDGEHLHKDLSLCVRNIDFLADRVDDVKKLLNKDPKVRGYSLTLAVEMPRRKGTGIGGRVQQYTSLVDGSGVLQFAESSQDAPIVHFGGPLAVALFSKHQLTIDRETDVVLGVGCRGAGPGTWTWIEYGNVIPVDKYPTLDIVYPPKHSGDSPTREHYELKHRC